MKKFTDFGNLYLKKRIEAKTQSLIEFAHRIIDRHERSKDLNQAGNFDKKEFEKDIKAFILSKDSPSSKEFNKNHGELRREINKIADLWNIDHNI